MDDYQLIAGFLTAYFSYEHYETAIGYVREAIAGNQSELNRWKRASGAIKARSLSPGQPLALVNEAANQVLAENSDKEAYHWLDKMVHNVERTDGVIEEY
jgi:hypothetical protein